MNWLALLWDGQSMIEKRKISNTIRISAMNLTFSSTLRIMITSKVQFIHSYHARWRRLSQTCTCSDSTISCMTSLQQSVNFIRIKNKNIEIEDLNALEKCFLVDALNKSGKHSEAKRIVEYLKILRDQEEFVDVSQFNKIFDTVLNLNMLKDSASGGFNSLPMY